MVGPVSLRKREDVRTFYYIDGEGNQVPFGWMQNFGGMFLNDHGEVSNG